MAPYYEDLLHDPDSNTTKHTEDVWHDPTEVRTAALYITMVLSPILLLVGTVNNVASIVVMYRLSYKLWSVCMYLYILAVLDLVMLYVECGNQWIYELTNHVENISHMIMVISEATCKVYTFIFSWVVHFSSWLVIAVLIECYVVVNKPHEKVVRRKREHTRAMIIFIAVIMFLVNCHFFWTYGLIKPSVLAQIPYTICSYTRESSDSFRDYVWPSVDATIKVLAPLMLTILYLLMIKYRLYTKEKELAERYCKEKQYFMDIEAYHEIRKIFRVLGCVFLFILMLKSVESFSRFMIEKLKVLPNTYEVAVYAILAKTIFHVIYFMFQSTKFFLYLALSNRVRIETRLILKIIHKKVCGAAAKKTEQTQALMEKTESMKRRKDITTDTIATLV